MKNSTTNPVPGRWLSLLFMTLIAVLPGCSGLFSASPDRSDLPLGADGRNADPGLDAAYRNLAQHTFAEAGGDFDPQVFERDGDIYLLYASDAHTPNPQLFLQKLGDKGWTEQITHSSWRDQATGDHGQPDAFRFPSVNPVNPNLVAVTGRTNGKWDIFVIDLRSKRYIPVTARLNPTDYIHPSWSPDGKRIVYSAKNPVTESWEIRIMVFGQPTDRLLRTSQQSYIHGLLPTWCPVPNEDGTYDIAFQRYRDRGEEWYEIWTIAEDGQRLRKVVSSPDWAAINPAWSPDGQFIAFATVNKSHDARTEDRWDRPDNLWIARADGTATLQLTSHPSSEWNPVWGPKADDRDQLQIYFVSNRNGRRQIWSLEPVLPGGGYRASGQSNGKPADVEFDPAFVSIHETD
jgi:dipeptidyl aminopeptidase/acylaminoacyl peptidase